MTTSDGNIVLNLAETNDLIFKMKIKGSSKRPSIVRLVFEGQDYSYSVPGQELDEDDMYKFVVPSMEERGLDEGTYKAAVEVVVDGRHFAPVEFSAEFIRPIEVQVESIVVSQKPIIQESMPKKASAPAPAPRAVFTEPEVEVTMSVATQKKYKSLKERYETRRK